MGRERAGLATVPGRFPISGWDPSHVEDCQGDLARSLLLVAGAELAIVEPGGCTVVPAVRSEREPHGLRRRLLRLARSRVIGTSHNHDAQRKDSHENAPAHRANGGGPGARSAGATSTRAGADGDPVLATLACGYLMADNGRRALWRAPNRRAHHKAGR